MEQNLHKINDLGGRGTQFYAKKDFKFEHLKEKMLKSERDTAVQYKVKIPYQNTQQNLQKSHASTVQSKQSIYRKLGRNIFKIEKKTLNFCINTKEAQARSFKLSIIDHNIQTGNLRKISNCKSDGQVKTYEKGDYESVYDRELRTQIHNLKKKMSQQDLHTHFDRFVEETPVHIQDYLKYLIIIYVQQELIFIQDSNAIQGSRDLLVKQSRPIVDQIFSPFQKRNIILSVDEKKVINEFITKVDPRAPDAVKRKLNTKALVMKECQKSTEDGRVDPQDAKKYLKSKSKRGLKIQMSKRNSQSLQRLILLKDLDLELISNHQQIQNPNKIILDPLQNTSTQHFGTPMKTINILDISKSSLSNNSPFHLTRTQSFQQSQKNLIFKKSQPSPIVRNNFISPTIAEPRSSLLSQNQNSNLNIKEKNSDLRLSLKIMEDFEVPGRNQNEEQFLSKLTTNRLHQNKTDDQCQNSQDLMRQSTIYNKQPFLHKTSRLFENKVQEQNGHASSSIKNMRTSGMSLNNSMKSFQDPYMRKQFLQTQHTFAVIDEMGKSRNNDVQVLGSIISECGSLNRDSQLSPYMSMQFLNFYDNILTKLLFLIKMSTKKRSKVRQKKDVQEVKFLKTIMS